LLELEAARHLQALPAHLGWQLRQALMALRAAAHERAESCWLRRRSRLAMYWRCCAVYAGHCARLISTDESGARGRNEPDSPNVAIAMTRPPPHAFGRPPLLGLPEALSLLGMCEEASGPLRTLLIELRAAAHAKAQHSWVKRKGPLAAYWRDVSTHAGLVERLLR
uniref:hypothetical protein n=1 Tax=Pseudomonas aeruginosa TaxID=287 RepID=UPI0009AB30F1